jgi:dihydrodiol dehydrogenase / D-xylose 1-dehydrogenase (NADP)
VDVVYVGTIHPYHMQAVLMMFDAGKPVLCEKPLTCSAADTKALIEAAREKGVFLMEVGERGWRGEISSQGS